MLQMLYVLTGAPPGRLAWASPLYSEKCHLLRITSTLKSKSQAHLLMFFLCIWRMSESMGANMTTNLVRCNQFAWVSWARGEEGQQLFLFSLIRRIKNLSKAVPPHFCLLLVAFTSLKFFRLAQHELHQPVNLKKLFCYVHSQPCLINHTKVVQIHFLLSICFSS